MRPAVLAYSVQPVRHPIVMAVIAQLAQQFAPFVDFIYPPRCPACGVAIGNQAGLCIDCWRTIETPANDEKFATRCPCMRRAITTKRQAN
jgi:hypothetical protein